MLGWKRCRERRKQRASLIWIFLLVLLGPTVRAEAQGGKTFYEGKTIQLLVASGPGATTDISARLVGRYLGKHMPGNPGVVVRNMSGGGGLIAANYLYNVAKPDGLTIAAVSRANYMEQIIGRPEVKSDFGKFSGCLLVGNFGDGKINAYCQNPGGNWHHAGRLRDGRHALSIDGLWGIGFGNGGASGDPNVLYFAAGPDDETEGYYGRVDFEQ